MIILAVAAFLLACSSPARKDSGDPLGFPPSDTAPDPLPDLVQGLDGAFCDKDPFGPGATEYWLGVYYWATPDDATGREIRLWYANTPWRAQGGTDCTATWTMTARKGSPGSCSTCDYSLAVDATFYDDSNCDPLTWKGDETWSTVYDIDLNDDGTLEIGWSSSGTPIGSGYWNAEGLEYLSSPNCKWF